MSESPVDLFLFVPVFLSIGIGLWFTLSVEPGLVFYSVAAGLVVALALLARFGPWLVRPFVMALACAAAGVLACGVRVWVVTSPVLASPYYGPVQGRIIDIDRSQSDAIRLTLDQVVLSAVPPEATPFTVRVSLHGPKPQVPYEPGTTVEVTARLAAPEGASEPGGFDFRRMAWFQKLGAVGYTPYPVVTWAPPQIWDASVNRLRNHLSAGIMAAVPGDAGAFGSGALTGDRSEISAAVVSDLRISSLAHLLAISGMNMAFLTGFVFALIRYGLALVPWISLRVNTKKVAAYVALAVALFYLVLSGANVATTRAFLMVSIMLGAVIFDRRALTLRSVALAAILLLMWQPESLLSPGFQLSFAATIALISGFRPAERFVTARGLPGWLKPLAMLTASSLLAGLATAPYSAATFNRLTGYGLLANLLTVPVMDVLMGAGAMAALLAPIGLAGPALAIMGWASWWILFIAHWISTLNGAITPVPQPGPWVIPLLTLGMLWTLVWQGRARLAGLVPVALGFVMWAMVERPLLLISSDGVLAGVLGTEGRALSSPRGAGFAAESWLADDGDLADPKTAALRPGFEGQKTAREFQVAGVRGVVLSGKEALSAVSAACAGADIVLVPARLGPALQHPAGCTVIDAAFLAQSGAIAGLPDAGGLLLMPVRAQARVWTGNAAPVPALRVLPNPARIAQVTSN
ncbi:MAG: ComEC/Rec2 family competence protein [Cypionkella sp.]